MRALRSVTFAAALALGASALASEKIPLSTWAAPPLWSAARADRANSTSTGKNPSSREVLALPSSPLPFVAIAPCRQYDSRSTTPLLDNTARTVTLTGVPCGIPTTTQAVSVNITILNITGTRSNGLLRVGTVSPPPTSWINYPPTETQRANAGVVPLTDSGAIVVQLNQGAGSVDLVIDVNGYYAPETLVNTVNGISGDVTLAAGAGIRLDQAGQQLTISTMSPPSPVAHDGSLFGDGTVSSPLGVRFSGSGVFSTAAHSDHNHDLQYQKVYARTVVVSPVGTPIENGDALRNALAGITTATADNPWLVKIEPGIYDIRYQTISMVPYVDMEGSGEGVTTITGGPYYYWGASLWTANAELRFLTVESYGGSDDATALYNPGGPVRLLHVTLRARGGTLRTQGMWSMGGTFSSYVDVTLRHVTISASGSAGENTALKCDPYVNLDLEDVSASAEGHPTSNNAIYLWTDKVRMWHVTANAGGAGTAVGTYYADLIARDVEFLAQNSGGMGMALFDSYSTASLANARVIADNTGIYNFRSSLTVSHSEVTAPSGLDSDLSGLGGSVLVEHSSVSGGSFSLRNAGGTMRVGSSRLDGPVLNTGTLVCAAVYDSSFTFFPSSCK